MGTELEGPRCPVCASGLDGEVRRCERCATPHHRDCWDYAGGCAVFGCVSRAPVPAGRGGWGPVLALDRLVWAWYWHQQLLRLAVGIFFLPWGAWVFFIPLGLVLGPRQLEDLYMLLVAAAGLGFMGSFLIALPMGFLRWLIERQTGAPLFGDRKKAQVTARRMEAYDSLWTVVRRVRSFLGWAALGAWLVAGLLTALAMTGGVALGLGGLGCMAGLGYLVFEAYHDSAVQIATVQNRLLASTKG